MADYFQHLFELRRRQPGDDLTTHLVQAEEAGDKLTNEELTANIILLFGAGHETTVNLIGNGVLALYRNPDQLHLLRNDPSLAPNAVEELLRYDCRSRSPAARRSKMSMRSAVFRSPKDSRLSACLGPLTTILRFTPILMS